MLRHKRFDLAFRLALQEIGDTALQMTALPMDDQSRAFGQLPYVRNTPRTGIMHDEMRHAANRDFHTGPDGGLVRDFLQARFQPTLVTEQKALDLRHFHSRRHGDAQTLTIGIDPQRQAPRAGVLHDPERQDAAGNLMRPLERTKGRAMRFLEKAEDHGRRLSDSSDCQEAFGKQNGAG